MADFSLRSLTAGEWEVYRALRLTALRDSPDAFGSTLARELTFPAEVWRGRLRDGNQLAAFDGDAPCGLVGVVPLPDGTAELVSLWVSPVRRGQGLGDRLVAAALRRARERGHLRVRLEVAAGNRHGEALFVRGGFHLVAASDGAVDTGEGSGRDIAMERPA